jgi:hypothetical protein
MANAPVTNHVAEVAVPCQQQITVRLARGEIELGQDYDHEWHAIHVQPGNVLTLVRSMLRMIGLDDVYLHQQKPGGLCTDVDWPDGPLSPREIAIMASRPDIDWHAVNREFNAIEAEVTEPQHLSLKERRELVAEALRRDPNRSNRAIAAECGVSDKTIGTVRSEIGAEVRSDTAELRTDGEQLRLAAR